MAAKLRIAYHIKHEEGREKPFWNRIGRAFVNKDGSESILLDYLPLPGPGDFEDGKFRPMTIILQDYKPKEQSDRASFSE